MRFEQLRYLEAALRCGSLRQAATQLDVSQPTLSAQIRRLEEDLGVVLIVRGARGVSPTSAAETLLPHIRSALQAERAIRLESGAISGLKSGRIALGVTPASSQFLLPKVVPEFRRSFPRIEFEVTEAYSGEICDGVTNGLFDFGIVARFLNDPEDPAYRYLDLVTGRVVLTIPEDHELAERDTIRVEDLQDQPMITFTHGSLLRVGFARLAEKVRMRPVYHINSAESAQELVRAGVGLALGHTLAPSTRSQPGVLLATLDVPWQETQLSGIMRADERPAPALSAFVQRLKESCRGQ